MNDKTLQKINDRLERIETALESADIGTITFVEGGWLRVLPNTTEFRYIAPDGYTREDVEDYVETRGILDACDISDGDFEQMLEDE